MARKPQKIPPKDLPILRAASRTTVENTAASLSRFIKRSQWLGNNNRYRVNTVERIDDEVRLKRKITNPTHLSQYIAASALLHASDGWGYLGKAISCMLSGDLDRAVHLAYYAELRATMSLLATVGIGAFSRKQFVLGPAGKLSMLKDSSGTHQFVWNALRHWSLQKRSGALFSKLVRPGGRSLDDWLAPIGGGGKAAAQAREWFLQWGMDLKYPNTDRDARNQASYRPSGIADKVLIAPNTSLEFVREMWAALEPTPGSTFDGIDNHILRRTIESLFQSQTGRLPRTARPQFGQFVQRIVGYQDFPPATAHRWTEFLLRLREPADLQMLTLSAQASGLGTSSPLSLVSRATLLLRVCSGSVSDLLSEAGYSADDLSFWWEGLGASCGLWVGQVQADELPDLWKDVSRVLGNIDAYVNAFPAGVSDTSTLNTELADILPAITGCERIGIWSLTPG